MQPAKMHQRCGRLPGPGLGLATLLTLLVIGIIGISTVGAYDIVDFTEPPFFTLGARLGYLVPVGYYGAESRGDLAGGLRLGWVIDIPADLSLNVVYAAPALQDVDYAGEEDVLPRQRG